MNFKIQSNSSVYDSLRTTVIKGRTISEGKMESFPNMEKENLPMKILLVTGKCLRELYLSLSGSSVIINCKSHSLLAFTRLTKEFRLHAILLLAPLRDGEGPLFYCIDRSQAGFTQYLSNFSPSSGKKCLQAQSYILTHFFKVKKKLLLKDYFYIWFIHLLDLTWIFIPCSIACWVWGSSITFQSIILLLSRIQLIGHLNNLFNHCSCQKNINYSSLLIINNCIQQKIIWHY